MFPQAPRVIFRKKPSEEVICQLRFPTILRISAEPPATFQERIRVHYPTFQEKPSIELFAPLAPEMARLMAGSLPGSSKSYQFISKDNRWTVHLDRDSLSLTTTVYERWEGFRDRFRLLFEALFEIYQPSYFS